MTQFLQPENAIETLRAMIAGTPELSGAEIFIRKTSGIKLKVRMADLEGFESSESLGLSMRFARRGKLSHAFTSSLDLETVKDTVVRAIGALDQATEDPEAEILPMLHRGDPSSQLSMDENFQRVPVEEKINRVLNLETKILQSDSRITKVLSTNYSETQKHEWLWTLGSNKTLHIGKSWASVSASAIAEQKGQQARGTDFTTELQYFDLDWNSVAKNAVNTALKILGGIPVPSGKYSVIFTQTAATDLLEVLSGAFLGDKVAYQESFLKDSLDKEVFSPLLTLSDDPHQKKRPQFALWDAEGTPTARLPVLTAGRVEGFAHTLRSAKKLGVKPTGHALRGNEKTPPFCGFFNFTLEPGRKDFVDLLRDMGRGLVIYEAKGIHSANLVTGDFSFGASGTYVENGEEICSVGQIALGGNLKDLFKNVVGIGRDLKFSGTVGAPSLLFDQVSVAGS